VANLAACFAETGRSVLVIDSDFRRPALARRLGAGTSRGLGDLLTGDLEDASLVDLAQPATIPGIRVVSAGPAMANPAQLLILERRLLPEAAEAADIVIIDTPDLLATNDAMELVALADSVVVCCRAGHTRAEAVRRASQLLARISAPVLGVALIGVEAPLRRGRSRRRGRGSGVLGYDVAESRSPRAPRPAMRTETERVDVAARPTEAGRTDGIDVAHARSDARAEVRGNGSGRSSDGTDELAHWWQP
jgi:Mrp family chromosome partitioning ATPase